MKLNRLLIEYFRCFWILLLYNAHIFIIFDEMAHFIERVSKFKELLFRLVDIVY